MLLALCVSGVFFRHYAENGAGVAHDERMQLAVTDQSIPEVSEADPGGGIPELDLGDDPLDQVLGEGSSDKDSVFLPYEQAGEDGSRDFIVLPNPLRERNTNVVMMCRTRCVGNALVNVYDAVGTMLFKKVVRLQQPDAVGYKMCIPWDCRNENGRLVGNGTYLAVVRIFDTNNHLVARRTARIGIARAD